MPNVTLHWLLCPSPPSRPFSPQALTRIAPHTGNMVYLALVYPFIWLEINHVGESLYHIPCVP